MATKATIAVPSQHNLAQALFVVLDVKTTTNMPHHIFCFYLVIGIWIGIYHIVAVLELHTNHIV
jgi:hypothetical protein